MKITQDIRNMAAAEAEQGGVSQPVQIELPTS
jgi:hypothetical protein